MFTCIKRNKNYKARKLVIYNDDGKKITEVTPFFCWYSMSNKLDEITHKLCRELVMKNLYWLLGQDCEFDEWIHYINKWDHGRGVNGIPADVTSSIFYSDTERNVALNSFYNN